MDYSLVLDQSLLDDILLYVLSSRFPYQTKWSTIRILIDKGADVHATLDGDTLLHIAISSFRNDYFSNGYQDLRLIVETLVDAGCDAFASNSRGKTPLHLAVTHGYVSTVKYLLWVTALPCLPDDTLACAFDGRVALTNWKNTSVLLHLLIKKGRNVHVQATDGGSLLHSVIKKYQPLQTPPQSTPFIPFTISHVPPFTASRVPIQGSCGVA